MKLETLHEDILWEDEEIALTGTIISEKQQLRLAIKGKPGKIMKKGIDAAARRGLNKAGIIGAYAYDQLKRYKTQKYKTITFYARKHREKRTYDKLVKTLTGTGQYKVVRTFPYAQGGRMWELKHY
jgi:hypothetical protein